MRTRSTKRVLIIQGQMKQYRVPFFVRLHQALEADGVQLRVAYSPPLAREISKRDNVDLPEEFGVKVRGYWLSENKLVYQPLIRRISEADLVIVEQANKHLLNPLLLSLSRMRVKTVAFWGHGRNLQGDRTSLSEKIKRRLIGWVNWWFAYTRGVRDYVVNSGFPANKVTVVNNSIDTSEFARSLSDVSAEEIRAARQDVSINEDSAVGLFCGALYRNKHLDFLLEASELIHQVVPNFHLIVVGGGPERAKVEAAARDHSWIHCLGPCFGKVKAIYFRLADIFLMPGPVGLAILDAFVAGLPLITTNTRVHGPELEYLENGVNGFTVQSEPAIYAEAVVRVLKTPDLLQRLRRGAAESSQKYSVEVMVNNFAAGIHRCLQNQVED